MIGSLAIVRGRARHIGLVLSATLMITACGRSDQVVDADFGQLPTTSTISDPPTTATAPRTTAPATTTLAPSSTTTTPPATSSTTTTPTSTTSSTTSTSTTTTTTTQPATVATPAEIPASGIPVRAAADPTFAASSAALDRLAAGNLGASLSISRAGELTYSRAVGPTVAGGPADSDTPMVVASVSKLIVGVTAARLIEEGLLSLDEPVPWGEVGILPDPAWLDVTIRELMHHSSGLPTAQASWFEGRIGCPAHLQSLVNAPPQPHRGVWTYSNGNYCLLGLVVSARTGLALDAAVQHRVFGPVGADGVHLTDNGLLPGDMPHPHGAGVARLSRLGGAGSLVVSTDDLALAIGRMTPHDRSVLAPPAVFTDQYGFGHTGTIDGAKSCVWALDGGDTVVAATIAGNDPYTGGAVCDIVVPAVARDLGIDSGPPDRTP